MSTANFSTLVNETYPQSPALRLDTSNFPNAFHGVAPETFADAGETVLTLCDGGLDGQLMPLQPMLVPDRNVDVIVAIDVVRRFISRSDDCSRPGCSRTIMADLPKARPS